MTENNKIDKGTTTKKHSVAVVLDEDIKNKPVGPKTSKHNNLTSISRVMRPQLSSLFKAWADVSKINYFAPKVSDIVVRSDTGLRSFSFTMPKMEKSLDICYEILENANDKDVALEQFPKNVSFLLNEENKWGCFYIFPEYYSDIYSPVIRISETTDRSKSHGGVLTKDLVSANLSYLRRCPLLDDYVYIKLDLSSQGLTNIDILAKYKYLVYLNLDSNRLTELNVLSQLLYLQYLTVAYNNFTTVLEYSPPPFFLTEVIYKYNSVIKINDLSAFWSITVLDLSHNNIKWISGLETLRYLRRLDLSFNHIQCLENLNHLRLIWLDVSYNNISTFELGEETGLWTLLHLEYLNLNENSLTSFKLFLRCTRLRELHLRNNCFTALLELAEYMKEMRRLVVLDVRANPIRNMPSYKEVVINTFPLLLVLDAEELDPIGQRSLKMDMYPDVTVHATRRLLRLLYIQQLSRAVVSPFVPPGDTTEVPIVVIVGHEAVGKGKLARRLATECSSQIELARQHTTAVHHYSDHYIEITHDRFYHMLLEGNLLTYSEVDGQSYGLSREEAYVKDGKVKVVTMDLIGALMLKLRGYRPYLILATMINTSELVKQQSFRRESYKFYQSQRLFSQETSYIERATLQVLVSGRILVTGILNEIIMDIAELSEKNIFAFESGCSVMMNSTLREKTYDQSANIIALLTASDSALSIVDKEVSGDEKKPSLYSLFKESPGNEYGSYTAQGSCQSRSSFKTSMNSANMKPSSMSHRNQTPGSSHLDSLKSSKSVTFTENTDNNAGNTDKTEGMLIEPQQERTEQEDNIRSISSKAPWPSPGQHTHPSAQRYVDDMALWLAFLTEARQLQASEVENMTNDDHHPMDKHGYQTSLIDHLQPVTAVENNENLESMQTLSTSYVRENYENIHRKNPGLFLDTVTMDDPDKAFIKMRGIIKDIINSQNIIPPMFDIDFQQMSHYPGYEEKLNKIREEIAPNQLFF